MKTFLSGSSFEIAMKVVDATTSDVDPGAVVSYAVMSAEGEELSQDTALIEVDGVFVIPSGGVLAIASAEPRAVFSIVVKVRRGVGDAEVAADVIELDDGYQLPARANGVTRIQFEVLLESAESLMVGVNSFQTYATSLMVSQDLFGIESFNNAERRERVSAMAHAYRSLCTIAFKVDDRPIARLSTLSRAQLSVLPSEFFTALRSAQILEASEALNPDSVHRKRQEGLMSESIGESSMMFRPEKVLTVPVTRRSLDLLRPYLAWEVGVGRA